jgi:serine-type D-Ala-D-Ala carboxypeptidase/endopeptidase (penicillin-binding protein 4)
MPNFFLSKSSAKYLLTLQIHEFLFMIKYVIIGILFFFTKSGIAQINAKQLQDAIAKFEKDAQMENAIFSLYVIDAETGTKLYGRNENIGLATASCLKLVTSATAYSLLGKDFKFETKVYYSGKLNEGVLNGDIIIQGSGDPSLGSPRWDTTTTSAVQLKIARLVKNAGIKKINGNMIIVDGYSTNVTPSNWIWEDLGNYYGAPSRMLNWRENQYDLHFATGKKSGDSVTITQVDPEQPDVSIINEVNTAAEGSGDNSIIYLPPFANYGVVKGTLPAGEKDFIVSGAMPNPTSVFGQGVKRTLSNSGIACLGNIKSTATNGSKWSKTNVTHIGSILSPSVEKINFWFMRRSVNLFGEAFLNKMGEKETGALETSKGVNTVKNFWKDKGIKSSALNIYDGSGLSPANRVTTKALASVLLYATKQAWYNSYYDGFPLYNDMKLKSGTIGDVKGFCGYHTAKDGTKLIICFLANNFSGSSKTLVGKMFKVLDVLK